MQALRSVETWVNPQTSDAAEDAFANGSDGSKINLREPTVQGKRASWADVKKHLKEGNEVKSADQDEFDVTAYLLDTLDPTQRVFSDRLLAWGRACPVLFAVGERWRAKESSGASHLVSWIGRQW